MIADTLIYLSLGSNLGDRAANLDCAIAALKPAGVNVLRRSSLYNTDPVDYLDQPRFLNCVVEAETSLSPAQVLHATQGIERAIGAPKSIARGPRILDIDLLLYGTQVIRTPELVIPHPRMAARRFVLIPLAELAPELRYPPSGATIADLLAATPDKSAVWVWNEAARKRIQD